MDQEDAEMASNEEEEPGFQSEEEGSIAASGMGTEEHWDVSSNMTMEVPTSEVAVNRP